MVVLEGRKFAEKEVTKIEQGQTRGRGRRSKCWSFCENLIIEWPLWFSLAGRRKFGYPHFQTEPKSLTEMLECWIKNCSLKIYRTDNCCAWHISQYQQQRHNQYSYKQGVKLYSTTAAGVLASLLLDLKKVNVKFSIFIIEFENLIFTFGCLYACGTFLFFRLLDIVCTM